MSIVHDDVVSDKESTSEYWGARYFDADFNRAEWQAHPMSLERLIRLQGGASREVWFGRTHLGGKPVERAIGVGVGRAETEIGLLAEGFVKHFDLYDVSPVGLAHAKQRAVELGFGDRVSTHCGDIAEMQIPEGQYDLVTFVASLHHMIDLEGALRNVHRALKPNGLLWAANDYVGPDRFGYPEEHLAIVRDFHAALPKRFRKHGLPDLVLPTTQEVADNDPSEAPCSSQIIPSLRRLFNSVEVFDLYGSFAFMLFWGLEHDRLYDTPEGGELVKMVLALDEGMVKSGYLPSYFVHLIAHKGTGPVPSFAPGVPVQSKLMGKPSLQRVSGPPPMTLRRIVRGILRRLVG